MSYFKKFTDFCAGVAAFVASLLLIRDYMDFSPDKENPAKKLTQFLEDSATNDYKMLIFIVLLLVLSVLRLLTQLQHLAWKFMDMTHTFPLRMLGSSPSM